ncbi:hypothetical protein [Alteribacillus bidgolensis]|uniref:Uncharacterized protein n=1 Tax=Alteribacillus bidgolensis TaxID=930129 RepID=A0A1G8QN25_9BACI|nr:hypothetical protein [Alteribacillus bidgolensis]SDJ06078.1 hypothetical protein SAMN05216352_1213 [Alteribacillus bidgolensis]
MKKIVFIFIVIVSVVTVFIYYKQNNETSTFINTQPDLNLNNDYIVSYTSFTEDKSNLLTLNDKGIDTIQEINDRSLENLIAINNNYFIQSRQSGNVYSITNKGNLIQLDTPTSKNLTNNFIFDDSIGVLTNNGLHTENGKQIYKSGLLFFQENGTYSEINFDKGFFTSAVSLNNSFYVLTFDPSIEQEILLKIDKQGKILKQFPLANEKPEHGHKSLISLGDTIYIMSDTGKLSTIKDEQLTTKEIGDYGEVFKLLKDDKHVYVSFYNGLILKIEEDKVVEKINLEENYLNDQIFIDIQVKENKVHLLTVFDKTLGEQKKAIGNIISFNITTGDAIKTYELPELDRISPSSFEVL